MRKDIRQSSMHYYPTKVAPMSTERTAAEVRVNNGNSFSQLLHRKSKSGEGRAAPAPTSSSEDPEEDPASLSVNFRGTVITDLLYNLHRKSTKLIDTHVICRDGYIPVHRCVLMAASKLLRPILAEEDPAELASVSLPDYTVRQVLPVINSFYTGSTLFKQDALNATLELIQLLQADHGTTYTFQPAKAGDESLEPKMRHYATTTNVRSRRSSCTWTPKSRSVERTLRLDQICGNYAVDEESIFVPSEPESGTPSPAPDSLLFEPEDLLEDQVEDQEQFEDVNESNDSVDYNAISEMNSLGVDIEEVDGEEEEERRKVRMLSSLEIPATEFGSAMAAITTNASKTIMYDEEGDSGSTQFRSLDDEDDFRDSFEINLVNNVLVRPDVLKEHLNETSSMEMEREDDLMYSASSPVELETVSGQEPTQEKPPRVINGRFYTEIETTTFDEFGERSQIAQIITEPTGPSSEDNQKRPGPKPRRRSSNEVNNDAFSQQTSFKIPTAPTKKPVASITETPTFQHARIKVNPVSKAKAAEKQKRHEDLLFSMQLQENLLKGLAAIRADDSDSAAETDAEQEVRSPNKPSNNTQQKQETPAACTVNFTGSKKSKGPVLKIGRPKLVNRTAAPSSFTPLSTKSNATTAIEKSKKKSSSEVLALEEACNLVGGFLGPSSTRSSRSSSRESLLLPSPLAAGVTAALSQTRSRSSSLEEQLPKTVEQPKASTSNRLPEEGSELFRCFTMEIPAQASVITSRRESSSSTSSSTSNKCSDEPKTRSKSRESVVNPPTPESNTSRRSSKSSEYAAELSSLSPARAVEEQRPKVDEISRSISVEEKVSCQPATITSKAPPETRPTLTKGALKQVTVVEHVKRKRSQSQEEEEEQEGLGLVTAAKRPNMKKHQQVEIVGEYAGQLEEVQETQERGTSTALEVPQSTANVNVTSERLPEVTNEETEKPPSSAAEQVILEEPCSESVEEKTTAAAEPCVAEEAEMRTAIAKQLQESVKRLEDLAAKDYFSDPETSPLRTLTTTAAIASPEPMSAETNDDSIAMEPADIHSEPEASSGSKSAEEEDPTEEELNRQIERNMQRLGSAAPILPISISNEQRTPKSTKFFEEFVKKKLEKLQATEEHKKDEEVVAVEQPAIVQEDVEIQEDVAEEDFDDGTPGTTIIEGYEIVDYIPDAENEIVVENEVSVGEEDTMHDYNISLSSPPPRMLLPQLSRPGLIPDLQSSASILRLKLKRSPVIPTPTVSDVVELESLHSDPEPEDEEEDEEEEAAEVPLSHIANALEAFPTRAFQTEHQGLTYVIRNPTIVCNRMSSEKVKEKLQQLNKKITVRPESPPPPLLTKATTSTSSPVAKPGKSPPKLTISICGNSAFVKNRVTSSGQSSHPPKVDLYSHQRQLEYELLRTAAFGSNSQQKQKSARSVPSASQVRSLASSENSAASPAITGNDIEWYRKQLKQCPHCRKKHKSHKNATYCLGLHGYRRCIICLDLFKNHDTSYEQHLAKYHEISKGLVKCPICSQPYHVTGLITHVDRKHLRTPPNAESIPVPLPSPPLWAVKKDKNNKPRTYNNNNNNNSSSKRPKPPLPNLISSYRPPYAEKHYQNYQQNVDLQQTRQPKATQDTFPSKSSIYTSKGPMLSDDEDEENNPKTLSGYMTEAQKKHFAFKLFKPYDATKDLEAVIDQNIVTLAIAKKAFGVAEEEEAEVEVEEQSYGVYERIREERAEVVAEIAQLEQAAANNGNNANFEKPTGSEFVPPNYATYPNMTLNYTSDWPQCAPPAQQSFSQQEVAPSHYNNYQPPVFNQQTFDQHQYQAETADYEQQQQQNVVNQPQPQPYPAAYENSSKEYTEEETSSEPLNSARQQGRTLEEQIADQDFDTPIPEDLSSTSGSEEIVETVVEPEQVRLNIVDPPYSDQQIAEAVSTIQPSSPEAPSSPQRPTPAQDFLLDELNQQDQPSDLSINSQQSTDRSTAKNVSSSTRLPDMPQIGETTTGAPVPPQLEYLVGSSVTVSVTRHRNSVDSLLTSNETASLSAEHSSKSADDRSTSSPSKQSEHGRSNTVRNPSPSPTDIVVTSSPPTLQSLLGDDKSSDSYATATLIYEPVTPTPEDLTDSTHTLQTETSASAPAAPSQQTSNTTTATSMTALVSDEFDINRYISTNIVSSQSQSQATAEASVITSHQSKRHHHHHQISDIIQQPKKRYIQQFTDIPDYQAYLNQASAASAASAYGNMHHNLGNMHFGAHSSAPSFSSRHTPMNLHQSIAHHYDVVPHHHSTGYTSSTHSHHRSSGSSSSSAQHHHHHHGSSSNNPYNLSSATAAGSYHSQHLQISPYSSSASHYRHPSSSSSSGYHGRGDKMSSSASQHHPSNIHVDESGSLLCELTPVRSSYSNSLRYLATTSSALKAVGGSASAYDISSATAIDASTRPSLFSTPPLSSLHHQEAAAAMLSNPIGYTTYNANPEDNYRRSVSSSSSSHSSNSASTSGSSGSGGSHSSLPQQHDVSHLGTWGTTIRTVDSNQTVRPFDYGEELDVHGSKASIQCERCRQHFHLAAFNDHKCNY